MTGSGVGEPFMMASSIEWTRRGGKGSTWHHLAATPSQVYPRPATMANLWDRLSTLFTSRSGATAAEMENGGGGDPRKLSDQEILLGRKGESHAARYLAAKGFRILAKNLATPVGEIDILARYKEFLVFVEVKTRLSDEP